MISCCLRNKTPPPLTSIDLLEGIRMINILERTRVANPNVPFTTQYVFAHCCRYSGFSELRSATFPYKTCITGRNHKLMTQVAVIALWIFMSDFVISLWICYSDICLETRTIQNKIWKSYPYKKQTSSTRVLAPTRLTRLSNCPRVSTSKLTYLTYGAERLAIRNLKPQTDSPVTVSS